MWKILLTCVFRSCLIHGDASSVSFGGHSGPGTLVSLWEVLMSSEGTVPAPSCRLGGTFLCLLGELPQVCSVSPSRISLTFRFGFPAVSHLLPSISPCIFRAPFCLHVFRVIPPFLPLCCLMTPPQEGDIHPRNLAADAAGGYFWLWTFGCCLNLLRWNRKTESKPNPLCLSAGWVESFLLSSAFFRIFFFDI